MRPALDDDDVRQACALLERRLATIEALLARVDQLVDERARLAQALELLNGPARASSPSPTPTTRSPGKARRSSRRSTRRRGPKSANRDKALAFLEEHPGVQAGAVVEHLAISQGVAYNLLGRLVRDGLVEKRPGESGRASYHPRAHTDRPTDPIADRSPTGAPAV